MYSMLLFNRVFSDVLATLQEGALQVIWSKKRTSFQLTVVIVILNAYNNQVPKLLQHMFEMPTIRRRACCQSLCH
jgi:hypothetical protein